MSYELIAILMFSSMMLMLLTGQRVFADRALASIQSLAADPRSGFSEQLCWSVGRVRFDPEVHGDIDDLLRDADERMYADKTRKKKGTG